MPTVWIGIDDTDNADSPGTGQLARRVLKEIVHAGGTSLGTTRHQFFVDPRIPYTGHNRGICMAVLWEGAGGVNGLDFVFDLVRAWSAAGSDPGVCVARPEEVTPELIAWGERAMGELLTKEEAIVVAGRSGVQLRELGGTGGGIIGALGSVGLRAGGTHGRFVELPGLRELGESVTEKELTAMGIHLDHRTPRENLPKDPVYKTRGWVRPRLAHGQPVLAVEWSDDDDAWIPVDQKTVHPVE
jgi:hypothetical protein